MDLRNLHYKLLFMPIFASFFVVIGFDDIPFSNYMHPALSTVRQPLDSLGYRAIEVLDMYMKEKITELPCENLETELIIRQSVTVPRKK